MFPELPQDLASLTDEELAELHDKFQTGGRTLLAAAKARDAEVLGDRTQDDVDTELTSAAEALGAIRAEQKSREDDEQEFETKLGSHAETFGTDDSEEETPSADDDKGDEETTEETTDEETETTTEEPVTASARTRKRRPLPLASARHAAVAPDVDASGFRSQIRSDAIKVSYGDQLDRDGLGEVLNHAIRRNVVAPGGSMVVASVTQAFDDSRILSKRVDDSVAKIRKIREAVQQPEALTASGALCAPLEPLYDIFGVSTSRRPVRDALPSFQASRGGVITRAAPSMGVYEDAVFNISADDNASGGSLAVKNCMRLICPDPESVEVSAIGACTEWDNLAAKSDPELMAAVADLVMAEHARKADSFLLDGIKAGSHAVVGDAGGDGGAVFNLLGDAFKIAAGYRSRNRMDPNATLTGLFPFWLVEAIALDNARAAAQKGTQAAGRAAVEANLRAMLGQAGIAASFYLDSATDANPSQIFPAQGDEGVKDFPTIAEWFVFAPGTWLHLDSGTLDLGVVRDSVLNSTNDFQTFSEGWENVAYVGVESDAVTTAICPSGTFSAGIDNKTVC